MIPWSLCLRAKSTKTRIETLRNRNHLVSLKKFKSKIHQNKDWNLQLLLYYTYTIMFKSKIHQNKDWNISFFIQYKIIKKSLRAKSTKTRIETHLSFQWAQNLRSFKSKIHQNKDWNRFSMHISKRKRLV